MKDPILVTLGAAVLIVGGVAAVIGFSRNSEAKERPAPLEQVAPEQPAATDEAAADATPPIVQADTGLLVDVDKLTPEQKRNTIVLPDGSRVMALNGCTNTENLSWPAHRTKSPVVRIVRGKVDWYEHADGTLTTTQLVIDPNTGEWASSGVYGRPVDALPNLRTDLATDERRIDSTRVLRGQQQPR